MWIILILLSRRSHNLGQQKYLDMYIRLAPHFWQCVPLSACRRTVWFTSMSPLSFPVFPFLFTRGLWWSQQAIHFLRAPGGPCKSSGLSLLPASHLCRVENTLHSTWIRFGEERLLEFDLLLLQFFALSHSLLTTIMALWPFWMAAGCHKQSSFPSHTAFALLAQGDGWVLEAPGAASGTAGWRNICLLSPLISTVTVTVLH